ncbi:MAG: L,D-transpeptidase [Actinomycetota bacterium]
MSGDRRRWGGTFAGVVVLATLVAAGTIATGGAAAPARAAVVGDPGVSSSAPTTSGDGRPDEIFPVIHEDPPTRYLLVAIERAIPITRRAGAGRVIGAMPAGSRYYGVATVAWVRRVSGDGRFGLVDVPYVAHRASGWIRLRGLDRSWTRVSVTADLSSHRIAVRRGDVVLFRAPAATGSPASPTPVGRYFVTDRVAFPGGGVLGTFAFGISGIQPRLPAGWSGGDQLAIHGTNAPSTIGRSASAGCLRVSERILDRLQPLLRLGTPVIVRR